jgi:ribose/xylose/arabinose/galactoside ABC-type transport system permease subunit
MPAFIITLATMQMERGAALRFNEGRPMAIPERYDFFLKLGNHRIGDVLPVPVLVMLVLFALAAVLLHRTRFGQQVYAIGGNREAARFTGIPIARVEMLVYVVCSVFAGIAGLINTAQLYSAEPASGVGFELNAIAAAVVGGCSLTGGVGTVPGTVLGTIFLRVVIDAISKVIKTEAEIYEGLIVGVVVVLAVTFSQVGQLAKGGRRLLPGALGLCAIPTLAILAGGVVAMTASPRAGAATGLAALAVLAALRAWEGRRQAVSA